MGLDTTHDCWHGSYSSFARWRTELARTAGRPVGAVDDKTRETYLIEGDWHNRNFQGWWDDLPVDPLDVLLIHSDCDGFIFGNELKPLADRLEELLPQVALEWQGRTARFIAGLRQAEDRGEIVEFR